MAEECRRYGRLAELLEIKKGEDYSTTIAWVRTKVSLEQHFYALEARVLLREGTI